MRRELQAGELHADAGVAGPWFARCSRRGGGARERRDQAGNQRAEPHAGCRERVGPERSQGQREGEPAGSAEQDEVDAQTEGKRAKGISRRRRRERCGTGRERVSRGRGRRRFGRACRNRGGRDDR